MVTLHHTTSYQCSPLEVEGEGGEISMSMDSPLHRDRLDLGVMLGPSVSGARLSPGLLGVRIPAMAGPDTCSNRRLTGDREIRRSGDQEIRRSYRAVRVAAHDGGALPGRGGLRAPGVATVVGHPAHLQYRRLSGDQEIQEVSPGDSSRRGWSAGCPGPDADSGQTAALRRRAARCHRSEIVDYSD